MLFDHLSLGVSLPKEAVLNETESARRLAADERSARALSNLKAQCRTEFHHLVAALFDHTAENVEVKFLVFVNGYVPKAHHAAQLLCHLGLYSPRISQQLESLPAGLRDAEMISSHYIHREIYGGLAGPFEIQNDPILM